MSAVVVMPWSPVDADRDAALRYVHGRLAGDGWPVLVGGGSSDVWCKAEAVGTVLAQAEPMVRDDTVLVVHDADVVVDLGALRQAVAAVEAGAGWAMPHGAVHRLTQAATQAFYETGQLGPSPELQRWPYIGVEGGGVAVMLRSTYDAVPLDRRFVGWGDEDQSWGWALGTLVGAPWRSDAPLYHLFHPHASPGARWSPRLESHKLRRAYRAYRGDAGRMRALLDQAR